jgi:glycine/D-amino acid oxidase-like deaminating enzyme
MLQQKVLIVDGGITGLMSAYWATRKGYEVSLVSKSPDPHGCSLFNL